MLDENGQAGMEGERIVVGLCANRTTADWKDHILVCQCKTYSVAREIIDAFSDEELGTLPALMLRQVSVDICYLFSA